MLSGDESILAQGSPAAARTQTYASALEQLHVIVGCRRRHRGWSEGSLSVQAVAAGTAFGRWLGILRAARNHLADQQVDVVTTQDADFLGGIGYLIGRGAGSALQVQVHTDISSRRYRLASWREYVRFQLARLVLPRADCVRAVSGRVAEGLEQQFGVNPERIRVLPVFLEVNRNGDLAEVPRGRADRLEGELHLLAAGRFVDREKGFGRLLEAMQVVAKEDSRVSLTLIGEGPDRKRLERKAAALGLGKVVRLEAWSDDLAERFPEFDVFVLPSNYEGWPRVALEAAAAGLPVITTDVGLAGELLFEGVSCRVVAVGDHLALARAILSLARDPVERARFGKAGKRAVVEGALPSWSTYRRAYRQMFEDCRSKRGESGA